MKTKTASSDHPYPSAEEMIALYERKRAGDGAAREEMILQNKGLAIKVVCYYMTPQSPYYEDILQWTLVGLQKAVDTFDPKKNPVFSTWGTLLTRQHAWKAMGDTFRNIRLPKKVGVLGRKVDNTRIALEQEHGREIRNEEIADELGLEPHKLNMLIQFIQSEVSLDAPIGDGSEKDILEYSRVTDPSQLSPADSAEMKDDAWEALEKIKDLHRFLKEYYKPNHEKTFGLWFGLFGYGKPQSLRVVKKIFGISHEAVRDTCKGVFLDRRRASLPLQSRMDLLNTIEIIKIASEAFMATEGMVPLEFRKYVYLD